MDQDSEKYLSYDDEIRKDIDDSGVDYAGIESKLDARIRAANELGALSVLRAEEIPDEAIMDRAESDLFSRIKLHEEYDEPVNECIREEIVIPEQQWNRIESRIDEHIDRVSDLQEWELELLTSREPPEACWNKIEEKLFDTIAGSEATENFEQITAAEIVEEPARIELSANELESRILNTRTLCDFETVLKSERILSFGQWERIEENLFDRIDIHEKSAKNITSQPFWYIIDYFFAHARALSGVAVLLALFVFAGIGAINVFYPRFRSIPTLIYQAQGVSADQIGDALQRQTDFATNEGGSVTLVNRHGFVELQDGSGVKIKQATSGAARYEVSIASRRDRDGVEQGGRASFFVNRHDKKERFEVSTPDYRILVTGTYFRVEPDFGGRVLTRVLEGSVKIVSVSYGDTVLSEGQSLVFDSLTNRYRVLSGGPTVLREEIELAAPRIEDLLSSSVIMIRSTVPEAVVRIDGKFKGTTPFAIRQTPGAHRIWVGKEGYSTVDSQIIVGPQAGLHAFDAALVALRPVSPTGQALTFTEGTAAGKPRKPISHDEIARKFLAPPAATVDPTNTIYTRAQNAERVGDWTGAIKYYRAIFDDNSASKLRREDALFSIGKLTAERQGAPASAREIFLTYLALYPDGCYAGESWLRLAELEFGFNPAKAIEYYLKYFEMFPRHRRLSELQNRVGVIYLQEGNFDEAVVMFRQALTNMVSNNREEQRNIYHNLYRALSAQGDQSGAEQIRREHLAEK